MLRRGRWLAVLCILVIVAAALFTPTTGGSPSAGILVPLAPLFGLVVLLAVRPDDEPLPFSFVASPPLPSRAPPSRLLSATWQAIRKFGGDAGSEEPAYNVLDRAPTTRRTEHRF